MTDNTFGNDLDEAFAAWLREPETLKLIGRQITALGAANGVPTATLEYAFKAGACYGIDASKALFQKIILVEAEEAISEASGLSG